VNSALKTQCQIVKSTLLQTAFSTDFANWSATSFVTQFEMRVKIR